jgi:carbohydrate-selective porin OprB
MTHQFSNEWLQQFLEDREQLRNDPTYRAELTTMDMHLGRPDANYPTTPDEVQKWFAECEDARAARTAAKEEAEELTRQFETKEHIFSYPDGSVYMGHMRTDISVRHGRGTLRTPAFVYGEMKNYTSEEAADNAHLAKWHEYSGTWENDKLHGHGVHVQKSGDGGEILVFEGIWEHGKPMRANIEYEYDSDGNVLDDSVFGW